MGYEPVTEKEIQVVLNHIRCWAPLVIREVLTLLWRSDSGNRCSHNCWKSVSWYNLYREGFDNIYLFNKFIYFIYLFLASLGLCCCTRAFSSCGGRGASLCCGSRASHCGGFSCCGARALGAQASVVVAHRLRSCGSRALERRLSSCGARA